MNTHAKNTRVSENIEATASLARPGFDGPTVAELLDKLNLGRDLAVQSDLAGWPKLRRALTATPWPMMLIMVAWSAVICFFGREILSTLLPIAR